MIALICLSFPMGVLKEAPGFRPPGAFRFLHYLWFSVTIIAYSVNFLSAVGHTLEQAFLDVSPGRAFSQ